MYIKVAGVFVLFRKISPKDVFLGSNNGQKGAIGLTKKIYQGACPLIKWECGSYASVSESKGGSLSSTHVRTYKSQIYLKSLVLHIPSTQGLELGPDVRISPGWHHRVLNISKRSA